MTSRSGVESETTWRLAPGDALFPAVLATDPEPPSALHGMGDPGLLQTGIPRVAIVGARRCTQYGRRVARELGRDLALNGISVVSGLAYGIDASAHEGALEAPAGAGPIGVVGSGLDHVYPRQHAALWKAVAERGCLLSEYPAGTAPDAWHFPSRNRILAALAAVVVVVEAHPASGTRHTVEAAIERDRAVLAVPGPVGSPASEGANQLLREGCAPACDVTDVLVALGLEGSGPDRIDRRAPPAPADAAVLAALDWTPVSLDGLITSTGISPGALSAALHRLQHAGWAFSTDGWWQRASSG